MKDTHFLLIMIYIVNSYYIFMLLINYAVKDVMKKVNKKEESKLIFNIVSDVWRSKKRGFYKELRRPINAMMITCVLLVSIPVAVPFMLLIRLRDAFKKNKKNEEGEAVSDNVRHIEKQYYQVISGPDTGKTFEGKITHGGAEVLNIKENMSYSFMDCIRIYKEETNYER